MSGSPQPGPVATPGQLRDTMPFFALIGAELLQATPELVLGRLDFAPERTTRAAE